jgi:hypothetical protein
MIGRFRRHANLNAWEKQGRGQDIKTKADSFHQRVIDEYNENAPAAARINPGPGHWNVYKQDDQHSLPGLAREMCSEQQDVQPKTTMLKIQTTITITAKR